jgi:hypothetical protein
MIGDRDILIASLSSSVRHFLNAICTVASRRVHVQITAQIRQFDKLREFILLGCLNFPGSLT